MVAYKNSKFNWNECLFADLENSAVTHVLYSNALVHLKDFWLSLLVIRTLFRCHILSLTKMGKGEILLS